jgi:hypothetical protein
LPGGIIDYSLAADASSPVRLEILDASGKVIRHYASDDPVPSPHPALDSAAYNKLCQRTPSAPDCALPLYWPAPPIVLSTRAGFHRFTWDLLYDPVGASAGPGVGGGNVGAAPRRTFPSVYAPWAPPATYTVRLTVDGATYTQPLALRLDPRVKTPAAGLAQLAALTRALYDGAVAAHAAYIEARAAASRLEQQTGGDVAALKAQLDSLAPPSLPAGRGGRGGRGRGGAPPGAPTLEGASNSLMAAAMAMQSADVTPTAGQVAEADKAMSDAAATMKRWGALKARLPH